jgi:hypothetical protein
MGYNKPSTVEKTLSQQGKNVPSIRLQCPCLPSLFSATGIPQHAQVQITRQSLVESWMCARGVTLPAEMSRWAITQERRKKHEGWTDIPGVPGRAHQQGVGGGCGALHQGARVPGGAPSSGGYKASQLMGLQRSNERNDGALIALHPGCMHQRLQHLC